MADSRDLTLKAVYKSATNESFSVVRHITAPLSDAVAEKVRCLETLRNAVDETQALVNKELTTRMEEDKAREAHSSTKLGVDEDKEEDNYGEDVQDEE
ncbi:hypothetical protein L249_0333 [Ophiocordyceps polyrhachis-furcata BCC 54312]|uniref:EKC/KEOPS complex subunit GON7 n=1 Tax=Ophiocordyceps polyrhachis-furcata BCC 54312 TaxID=1330021 RepID=A0A367LDS3_9HYPO|nr:hypothetical protein L249_0333 [Ophiocordyceps polyrhachis-furcata BCC 54312]